MISEDHVSGLRRLKATLRVIGEELEPSIVTTLALVEPTEAWAKGETMPGARARLAPRGTWRLESKLSATATPEEHLRHLLKATGGSDDEWKKLAKQHSVDVFVGIWMSSDNAAFSLTAGTLEEMGRRGWDLTPDIYFEGDDD
jgi:hypothetical protein